MVPEASRVYNHALLGDKYSSSMSINVLDWVLGREFAFSAVVRCDRILAPTWG